MTKKHFIEAINIIREYPKEEHEQLLEFMVKLGSRCNDRFSKGTFFTYYKTQEHKKRLSERFDIEIDSNVHSMLNSRDVTTRKLGNNLLKTNYSSLYKELKEYKLL